jgi:hypothetical protein
MELNRIDNITKSIIFLVDSKNILFKVFSRSVYLFFLIKSLDVFSQYFIETHVLNYYF